MDFGIGVGEKMCPKANKVVGRKKKIGWRVWILPVTGLAALIWFLIRVIPKPSRAMYPCQRAAFPLASGFVVWLIGLLASVFAFGKGKRLLKKSRFAYAYICLAVAAMAMVVSLYNTPQSPVLAAPPQDPLAPIGVAKGYKPGRVAWVHDADATNWAGDGDGNWWQSSHTNAYVVEEMLHRSIRSLGDDIFTNVAWDNIFRDFNIAHKAENIGYQAGEKITIKVNFVGLYADKYWPHDADGVDRSTYNIKATHQHRVNVSPQFILALLRHLVDVVGVAQSDISVGDTLGLFPNEFYDICHDVFPDVHYLDALGGNGVVTRTGVSQSSTPFYWSEPGATQNDYVPQSYADATYLINVANLKTHTMGGVTLCGKNNYGSLVRYPYEGGYYELHAKLPSVVGTMGTYRTLVDLMGQAHMGGKTLLFMVDGLYASQEGETGEPVKMLTQPFGNDWSSSIFVSQDPVAVDSVGHDFLKAEWPGFIIAGSDDYMHEAAEADNPASGTFYDPDHVGNDTELGSLGTHEHWNNDTDKQYTRNLGIGNGIEMMQIVPGDFEGDGVVGGIDLGIVTGQWLDFVPSLSADIAPAGGDGIVTMKDFAKFARDWNP